MDSAADRKSIRRKEKEARQADRLRAEVISGVMSTAAGRQWLWDTLASCHMFHTTFNGDALASAFAEGQRATGLAILSDIMLACPDQYIQAMRESNDRNATDERRRGTIDDGGDSGSVASAGDYPNDRDIEGELGWDDNRIGNYNE